MAEERLQKILSAHGYGSRRDCEKIIAAGVVLLNGKTAKLGDKADIDIDNVQIHGQRLIATRKKNTYIALYKPSRVISNIKKKDRRNTVIDLVDHDGYLFIVGRLDYLSEGLILLTDDGELANRLTHPRFEHEKEYRVLIKGNPTTVQLNKWRQGGVIGENYKTLSCHVSVIKREDSNTWLKVILKQGKKRQIREVGRIIGLPVLRIIRLRISTLLLGDLEIGKWRYLQENEIKELKNSCVHK